MKQNYFVVFGIIMLIPLVSCLVIGMIFYGHNPMGCFIYWIGCFVGFLLLTYVFFMSKILKFLFNEEMTPRSNRINLKVNICILIIFLICTCILPIRLILGWLEIVIRFFYCFFRELWYSQEVLTGRETPTQLRNFKLKWAHQRNHYWSDFFVWNIVFAFLLFYGIIKGWKNKFLKF